MVLYLLTFLFIAVLVPTDRIRLRNFSRTVVIGFPFLLLLLLAGMRVETGNDWVPYFEYYSDLNTLYDKSEDFEVGYRLFAYFIKSIGFGYAEFLFISTFLYLGIFFEVFKRQRAVIALIFLFYCTYLLGWMGTSRQVIALSLTLLAAQQLLEGRSIRFFLLVLVATTFHQTAIIFLLAWFLQKPIQSIKVYVVIIGFSFLIGQLGKITLPFIIEHISGIDSLKEKLLFYSGLGSEDLGHSFSAILGFLWYVKRLIFFGIFLSLRKYFNAPDLAFFFNAYVTSVVIFLIFDPTLPMIAVRGSNYFSVYELFLLASLVAVRARWSIIIIPIIILLGSQRLYVSLYAYHPDIFIPYKGQFINEHIHRESY